MKRHRPALCSVPHSGSAAVHHLLRPLHPADKLSTKTKINHPSVLRRRGKHPGAAGRISIGGLSDRMKKCKTPACFCLCAVTWLPVLPGNLLFTETTEQNVTGPRGHQLHLCFHTTRLQLKPLLEQSICSCSAPHFRASAQFQYASKI